MRISDWSSDVCSSDLRGVTTFLVRGHGIAGEQIVALAATDRVAARGHLEVTEANRPPRRGGQVVGRRGAIAAGCQGIAGDHVLAPVPPAVHLGACPPTCPAGPARSTSPPRFAFR